MTTAAAPPQPDATTPVATPQVDRVLRLVRRRMRVNRFLTAFGVTHVVAAAVALAWLVVARVVPVPRPGLVALGVLAVIALGLSAAAAALPLRADWTAWTADRWLRLPETLTTALELRARPQGPLGHEHLRRAERVAGEVDRLPTGPQVPVRMLVATAVLAVLAGGVAALGDPQLPARERAAAQQAAVAAQAGALREAADALARNDQPADREAAEQLRDLADQLDGTDLETALERLQAAEQRLDTDPGALAAQRTALAGLERALRSAPLAAGGTAAEQLDQLADDIARGRVDAEQAQRSAQQLDELARALGGQPELAQALTDAAAQVGGGTAGAVGALGAAADAARTAQQDLAQGEAAAAAAGAVASAADALRSAQQGGRPAASAQGQPGQAQGQGDQGSQPGQGGQGGGQGGQGARASGQQRSGRSPGGGSPGDAGTRDTPTGTLDTQTVYDPARRSGSAGEDLQIQGQDTGDEPETTKGVTQGPGQRNPALVPYQDVLTDYAQRATQTVERPGYPVRLRDTVREYFDGLADPG